MSLPYTPGPAVSFPARRSPMRPAQDAHVATVRDVSKPSGRTIPRSCARPFLRVDPPARRVVPWSQARSPRSRCQ